MTAHHSPERRHRAAHAERQLDGIRAYLVPKRPELTRILRVVASELDAENVAILAGLLTRSRSTPQRIREVLAALRDSLAQADDGLDTGHLDGRSDLDAAVRWHGARLDDLLLGFGR